RAFGDKAGIAVALLDDDERALQEAILSGPPPLGRGAPALDRLRAFAASYLDLLERSVDLLLVADRGAPGARHRSGAYAFWLDHDLFFHLRRDRGYPLERVAATVDAAVRGIAGPFVR